MANDDTDMLNGDGNASSQVYSGPQALTEEQLDEKYPHRPHNHSASLPFHSLFLDLFNPLRDNSKKPTGPKLARKKQGPHGQTHQSPQEIRRNVIERFISRWRNEVGDDIFPAFRLIIPEKDRERAMYGLKEKTIGKLLVQIMKIDKNSDDGFNLLNWKLPGHTTASHAAGDFAGRCFEVLSKRPLRTTVGDLTVEEVNEMLDKLSVASKEEQQLPIMQEFYQRMNPEELMWLIRMVLRHMKIGATEKTFLDIWHPDAETLFNVSSNLRRVCWELYDRKVRLAGDETEISLLQCFQPQLAQFQMHNFDKMVVKMRPTSDDPVFWIEEKLDGERMQLHMVSDDAVPGGKRFAFWSRKAKDYTYLYGNGLHDDNSALTRHLKDAFHENVENIILDGEMITWDPKADSIVGFGSLKTAALEQQKNPFSNWWRPLFRVFDVLYLNDTALTKYTLRDRRKALETSIRPVHRRFEIHPYKVAETAADIEPLLRTVVAEASEGLVMKNPRSMYHLNTRNDDWIKIKPEYMTEFGEDLDCIVIGGYYGSGHRGGGLSSFLCGLRVDQAHIDKHGYDERKCFSFFKVGGGFTAADYSAMRHETEGKWHDWDFNNPPTHLIELGGDGKQYERPDVWIKPDESVVVSVKAASVHETAQFRVKKTLRFPRFKRLRTDKDWRSALSISEFEALKRSAEKERQEKQFKLDDERRKRVKKVVKKPLVIAGATTEQEEIKFDLGQSTKVFVGMNFYIMTDCIHPEPKSKADLETLVKHHGGKLFQSETANAGNIVCIADRDLVRPSALKKRKTHSIIRPGWLINCVQQAERDILLGREPLLIPYEPRHVYFAKDEDQDLLGLGVNVVTGGLGVAADEYGDAFARDIASVAEMRELLASMPSKFEHDFDADQFLQDLEAHGVQLRENTVSDLFKRCTVWFDERGALPDAGSMDVDGAAGQKGAYDAEMLSARNVVAFARGTIAVDFGDTATTHMVLASDNRVRAREVRAALASRSLLPRLVTADWVQQCWAEKTLLDEERFAP